MNYRALCNRQSRVPSMIKPKPFGIRIDDILVFPAGQSFAHLKMQMLGIPVIFPQGPNWPTYATILPVEKCWLLFTADGHVQVPRGIAVVVNYIKGMPLLTSVE